MRVLHNPLPAIASLLLVATIPAALAADRTKRVSVSSTGAQGNSFSEGFGLGLSANRRFVAFTSVASNLVGDDTNGFYDVFVHDRRTGRTERVNVGPKGAQSNGDTFDNAVALSAAGRLVALTSLASNLVEGDTNGNQDVFVHDRATAVTTRVSVASDGTQAIGGGTPATR